MDLLVFLDQNSSRVQYVFEHVFKYFYGLDLLFTSDRNYFVKSKTPKISYSNSPVSNTIFFQSSDLLFDSIIVNQELKISTYKGVKVFFLCSDSKSILPFDPFACIFYMLSRYEEYIIEEKDKFDRFPATASLAYKNSFLDIPVVDYWIRFIGDILKEKFPTLVLKDHTFKYINTIDVDNTFAYLEKGFFRNMGGYLYSFIKLDFSNILERTSVLLNKKVDPYDNYEKILSIHHKYNLTSLFFFLLGNYAKYDRNVSFRSQKLQSKIHKIHQSCEIGIHASYKSIKYPNNLTKEISRLENILGQKISKNRQHFISLNLPFTYQNLIKNNITDDYSMGFPSLPGFRAGTSHNFFFFDLTKNIKTTLLIHPFCVMDVTLKNYMNLTKEEAFSVVQPLIEEVKTVKGCFMSIWHNESFDNNKEWTGWSDVYETIIRYILHERT